MKALKIGILAAIAGLFGCSTTTVHLFATSLPGEVRKALRQGLEDQGFKVMSNDNEPPFSENIILYPPQKDIENELALIDQVLEKNGLRAKHSYAILSNDIGAHEYTAGNIGLYIFADELQKTPKSISYVNPIFPMTMVDYEFHSADCEKKYMIQFSTNETLTVNDFSLPIGQEVIAEARWKNDGNKITIFIGTESYQFAKSEAHREHASRYSQHVVTYSITLRPIGYFSHPLVCTYKSTYVEVF